MTLVLDKYTNEHGDLIISCLDENGEETVVVSPIEERYDHDMWELKKEVKNKLRIDDIVSMFVDDNGKIDVKGRAFINQRIKDTKKEIARLNGTRSQIRNEVESQRSMKMKQRQLLFELRCAIEIDMPVKELQEQLKRDRTIHLFLTPKKNMRGGVTQADIERAKHIPISNFITFNKMNKARCIWHNDEEPSMHYYKKDNNVYCFSCQKGGDVIEVVNKLLGKGFVGTVKFLIGK